MKINKYVSYLLGLALLSIGVILAIKANYGITVSTSPAFILSQRFDLPSFGVFNYLVQGLVFLITLLVLRTFKVNYLLSFGTSVIFGYTIDLFAFLMKDLELSGHPERILYFIASIIIISAGLVFFYRSNLPILPFDVFVRDVSARYSIPLSRLKLGFDLFMCTSSVTMSFIFFGYLRGLAIGTLLSALTIGTTIGFLMKFFDKIFVVTDFKKQTDNIPQAE